MNGMGGMGGGGKMSGHMATCPLCRGTGAVPVEVAQAAEVAPVVGDSPAQALASAMGGGMGGGMRGGMKRGMGGGGHAGHGG